MAPGFNEVDVKGLGAFPEGIVLFGLKSHK
jgi:hypothetical protein